MIKFKDVGLIKVFGVINFDVVYLWLVFVDGILVVSN